MFCLIYDYKIPTHTHTITLLFFVVNALFCFFRVYIYFKAQVTISTVIGYIFLVQDLMLFQITDIIKKIEKILKTY